jgi:mono/diheme cytochrome c family protein
MIAFCSVPSRRCRPVLTTTALVLFAGFTWSASPARPKKPPADPVDRDHAAKMTRGLAIFKQHVRPVLVGRCVRCHGGKKIKADFDLTDRDRLLRGGESGPAVIVGKSKDSLLYKLISHAKEPTMPDDGDKLPAPDIAHIAAWIDHGAPYDAPLVAKRKTPHWTDKTVAKGARQFWSFQPLRRVALPKVKNESWVRTPIDRFILARLEAAGIQPNAAVNKRHLIRRVYFDLVGLPPTPKEVADFENDKGSDAYKRLLDRLLSSPHHGERWARHWLDVARFAESHGFEHDYDRLSAYHYRDFVIKALNDDLAFDTFVKWQLAGDEFAPDNNQALTATGFLAAGVHSTQITKNEVEKQRYDEMDDMLATIGTSMLGLTVGCARCHDHKFDPIPQRDYYRLLSTFTTTVRSEISLNLDSDNYKNARLAFDKQHAPFVAALKKFETEQLPARLANWEKTWAAQPKRPGWIILGMASSKSHGGATFTKLDDGSLRAGGNNPPLDTYTFVAHTELTGITSVRLEALADPSLVKGGPGRAGNGNFALSDFRLTIAPRNPQASGGRKAVGVKPLLIRLLNPRATFEQKGLPVKAAIDNDAKSAWAIDPQFGKDHAAVFDTEKPMGFPGGTTLTFTLQFQNNTGHNIGRPRLSISTAPPPVALTAASMPQQVMAILHTPAARRSAAQAAALRAWYRTTDPEWQKLNKPAQDHLLKAPKPTQVKALISSEGLPAVRLHTQGGDFLDATHFLNRGDPTQKLGVAGQGFLQVLMPGPDKEKLWQMAPPSGWRTSYRRRSLANWITDVDRGAGHLLARVIVNRLWQHHLGRGIVATVSDFGTRGERPTHPELLDWLATELIKNGWHLKPIHKLIMSSSVYLERSQPNEAKIRLDRHNRLFWRRLPHRLEAEVIRDSLLAVSGRLDPTMFGPGTLDEGSKRRSIYFTVKRSKLLPVMQLFDAPEALTSVGERPTTTIAPQALLLMNNPHVRACARGFARRIASDAKTSVEEAVKAGYQIALTRLPTAEELAESVAFVKHQVDSYKTAGKKEAGELGYADLCQVLMCLNEFIYVD